LFALVTAIWVFFGRSIALRLGWVTPNSDDFVIRGWKAELKQNWEQALE
jgi:hypothetical protein